MHLPMNHIKICNLFDFHLSIIGKFIKLISIINQSIDYDIEFEEFEELALIIIKKYENMDHIKLIENIEKIEKITKYINLCRSSRGIGNFFTRP